MEVIENYRRLILLEATHFDYLFLVFIPLQKQYFSGSLNKNLISIIFCLKKQNYQQYHYYPQFVNKFYFLKIDLNITVCHFNKQIKFFSAIDLNLVVYVLILHEVYKNSQNYNFLLCLKALRHCYVIFYRQSQILQNLLHAHRIHQYFPFRNCKNLYQIYDLYLKLILLLKVYSKYYFVYQNIFSINYFKNYLFRFHSLPLTSYLLLIIKRNVVEYFPLLKVIRLKISQLILH